MIRNEFLNIIFVMRVYHNFGQLPLCYEVHACYRKLLNGCHLFVWLIWFLSPFTIHTGLSGEDLELRHTVFWCIYPSSRGDLFIRGTNYFFVIFLMIWYFVSFFDFFKSQTITSISCIFRPYLVSLTKDNEICYNVINNFTRKKYYRDYVI